MITPNFNEKSKSSILEYAKKLESYTLSDKCGDLVSNNKNKGNFGTLLEEFYFGYKPNSNSEADFPEAELELKSTPLKQLKSKKWVCKERLVLNIINYFELPNEDFLSSSFWKKNKNILLVFYLWEVHKVSFEYIIDLVGIWNFSSKDLKIIQKDWDLVKSKIIRGEAHLLSEGDTFYLGACTKGSTADKSYRKQPFSNELAKQRAFSLKRSYLNSIYETLKGNVKLESILSEEDLENNSIESIIINRFTPFYNLTDFEIQKKLGIELKIGSKNYFSSLSKRILGVKDDEFIEEFEKANIVIKSIKVEDDNRIKENISFPSFKFLDLIEEEWENSSIKELVENKFLFIFYKKDNENIRLEKSTFWNLSSSDLDEFERVFKKTKTIIKNGNIVKEITNKGVVKNNFPKSSQSYLSHVRPHGRNKNDTFPLPVKDYKTNKKEFTKQSFWINSSYVEKIYKG